MIMIKEDRSYLSNLDLKAIENGIAELGVYSLNFDRYYSEEQKQNNMELSYTMTKEQWNERCENVRVEIGNKIKSVIDIISEKFAIYQYTNEEIDYSQDDWDLFFWCNMTKDWKERDMSYVKLNLNKKRTNERQLETVQNVLELIETLPIDGIQTRIQYTAIYDEIKVDEVVQKYCETMKDQFIEYGGYTGKIVEFNGRYVFKKKGAKRMAYEINNNTVLNNVFAQ